ASISTVNLVSSFAWMCKSLTYRQEPTSGGEIGETRVEHDSMGEVRVPARAKWGAQTQRAVENFTISGQGLDRRHIAALGRIKGAAARANAELGVLSPEVAEAIGSAAD